MGDSTHRRGGKGGKKVRVPFRRNRNTKQRIRDWTKRSISDDNDVHDTVRQEQIAAKGDISRHRTITIYENESEIPDDLVPGTVIALRGLFVDVDDGRRIVLCTIRRILRTRMIEERHPITTGDRVRFRLERERKGVETEGTIEVIDPRRGQLRRHVGRRIHTIVANVDQAVIVASADQPPLKPHLIDRYIVASLAGEIEPVICLNKIDLDQTGAAREVLERYTRLGYKTLATSAVTGEGVADLQDILAEKESVIAGQSGVGKSSLLNAVEPGLQLNTGDIIEQINKGRHTTSTAKLLKLRCGGYVVDTPGIRSFDLSMVERNELEVLFSEFTAHVPDCKFPDCTHTHEAGCAVKKAVERNLIHPERYESYVRLFQGDSEDRSG